MPASGEGGGPADGQWSRARIFVTVHVPPPSYQSMPALTVFQHDIFHILDTNRARLQHCKATLHEEDLEGAEQHPCREECRGKTDVPGAHRRLAHSLGTTKGCVQLKA